MGGRDLERDRVGYLGGSGRGCAPLRGASAAIVFVAYDLMYVGAYLRDAIVRVLAGRIPGEAIFTTAVHTHSGPPTEVIEPWQK